MRRDSPGGGSKGPHPYYDPFDPSIRADPYPSYRSLREAAPVWRHPRAGIWFVSGYRDCLAVLRGAHFSAQAGQRLRPRPDALPPSMLNTDPPEHTRLRRCVAGAFKSEQVEAMVPGIRASALRLLGRWERGSPVDAVDSLAVPLAIDVLSRLLGIPEADRQRFSLLAEAVAPQLDPVSPPEPGSNADHAQVQLLDLFADLLGARLGDPTDDVLGTVAHSHACGAITAGEAMATCSLLVIGGFEPLVDLISTSLWLRLRGGSPGQWSTSAEDAVEEALRFEAPIQFTARVPDEEVTLSGCSIPANEPVVVLLGSANRDPEAVDRPEDLDWTRSANPHLSFGAGAHRCLGASLSRAVAAVALDAVAEVWPELRLDGAPVRRDSVVPRGFRQLHVLIPHG